MQEKKKKKVLIQPNFLGWNKEQQNYRPKLWALFFLCGRRKRVEFFVISQWTSKNDHGNGSYKRRSQFYSFSEYKKVLIDYSNIINLSYQKTIYIYIYIYIFFSSMCHSRCCPSLVGQPSPIKLFFSWDHDEQRLLGLLFLF